MEEYSKKKIVISAINFRSGGPLSILRDCLIFASNHLSKDYHFIVLIHHRSLISGIDGIEYIEFPRSVSSYFYRLYYEYWYFKQLSFRIKPYLWLSLHDMTPNVKASIRAVYCHNASPFYKITFREAWLEPKFAAFNLLYKLLYRINIRHNDFVIVQQDWMRKKFTDLFKIKNIIVAHPNIKKDKQVLVKRSHGAIRFFFPTLPRVFKNIEIIGQAVGLLLINKILNFEVFLTIDGTENRYAKWIYRQFYNLGPIKFVGKLTRDEVFDIYSQTDCLIFPSKLESWGLPITEFQKFDKPMLVADLEYAHETVGNYSNVSFFDPDNSKQLANLMEKFIKSEIVFDGNITNSISTPYANNWAEIFNILIK